MGSFFLGEFFTLALVATAISMDSFSVSIGLGMQGMRLRHIVKISVINGSFHMLMPLLGMLVGRYLSTFMGNLAVTIGGILLIFFGLHMTISSFFGEENRASISTMLGGIILFAVGVSIDAFSVGLSLGLFEANMWVMLLLSGSISTIFTAFGLFLGRKVGGWLGNYSEMIGGLILLVFGIKFLV